SVVRPAIVGIGGASHPEGQDVGENPRLRVFRQIIPVPRGVRGLRELQVLVEPLLDLRRRQPGILRGGAPRLLRRIRSGLIDRGRLGRSLRRLHRRWPRRAIGKLIPSCPRTGPGHQPPPAVDPCCDIMFPRPPIEPPTCCQRWPVWPIISPMYWPFVG